jgi:uncharacterized protein
MHWPPRALSTLSGLGKTTLVRDLFHGGKFITLDDEALLAAIEADPQGQLESLTSE